MNITKMRYDRTNYREKIKSQRERDGERDNKRKYGLFIRKRMKRR